MKRFSVIIPWNQRRELRDTLVANAPLFGRHAAEVIVVNCGGDPVDAAAVIDGTRSAGVRQVAMPGAVFNRSLACNVGALCSAAPWLFFLDADVVLDSDVFAETAPALESDDCFFTIRHVRESRSTPDPSRAFLKEQVETLDITCTDGRRASLKSFARGDGSRGGSGLLLLKRADLLGIGGYNSTLAGWGFEDTDVQLRLQFVLRLTPLTTGEVIHLTHGDEVRDVKGASRNDDYRKNLMVCFENYNQSRFLGSYADDVRTWQDRIRELPACVR